MCSEKPTVAPEKPVVTSVTKKSATVEWKQPNVDDSQIKYTLEFKEVC